MMIISVAQTIRGTLPVNDACINQAAFPKTASIIIDMEMSLVKRVVKAL